MDKHTLIGTSKNDIKDDKKIQQENSRYQHLKPSTSAFTTCQDNQTQNFKWPTTWAT